MKVLFNTSHFPKWQGESTAPFIFELARAIKKAGNEMFILSPHVPGARQYEIWEGIKIYRYKYILPSFLEKLFSGGSALRNLKQNKLNYLLIPPFLAFQLFYLFKICKKERIDILHSHWIVPQGLSGLFIQKFLKIPQVISIHGSDIFLLKTEISRAIKKLVLKKSSCVITNSFFTKKEADKLMDKKVEIKIIPIGIDFKRFSMKAGQKEITELKKQLGIAKKNTIILSVGRQVKEKGVKDLLRGFLRLRKKISKITLLIVGEGKERLAFENFVKKMKINDVIFCGEVSNELLPIYYQMSSVFVGASWREGLGITFIEASAAGCPVITTNKTGFSYYGKKYKSAIIIKARKPKEIYVTILRILGDLSLKKSLIENARKMVEKEFRSNKTSKKLLSVYSDLLENE